MTLEIFNGSGRVTNIAWVHKLETYLALHPMTKEDAIRFIVLHLDGVAHD